MKSIVRVTVSELQKGGKLFEKGGKKRSVKNSLKKEIKLFYTDFI